jgi:hypothetical protein
MLTYADVYLQVGGLAVTAGDLRGRLSAILAVELRENELTWREPKHRLGMTGGMGLSVCMYVCMCVYMYTSIYSVAEAELGVDLCVCVCVCVCSIFSI